MLGGQKKISPSCHESRARNDIFGPESNQTMSSNLPSQNNLSFLSVSDLQLVVSVPDAVDDDEFHPGGSANSPKAAMLDQAANVPVNYISPEVYALLAVAKASAARRAGAMDVKSMALDANGHAPTMQSALSGLHDASDGPTLPSPKRFCRTFWRSMSRQLLLHWAHAAPPLL
jgi:hypothetical protein